MLASYLEPIVVVSIAPTSRFQRLARVACQWARSYWTLWLGLDALETGLKIQGELQQVRAARKLSSFQYGLTASQARCFDIMIGGLRHIRRILQTKRKIRFEFPVLDHSPTLNVTWFKCGEAFSLNAHHNHHITKSQPGTKICREAFFIRYHVSTRRCVSQRPFSEVQCVQCAGEVRPVLE